VAAADSELRNRLLALKGKTVSCVCARKHDALYPGVKEICSGQVLLRVAHELAERG
jgi:hypothetical protein